MKSFKEFIQEAKKNDLRTDNTAWVILHTPSKLLLGKRAPGTNNPNLWNFFGGHVDQGETAAKAAARETQEEINFKINPAQLKQVAVIGKATYFTYKVDEKVGKTTDEISALKTFKMTDLPDNLHSKTALFLNNLETLLY